VAVHVDLKIQAVARLTAPFAAKQSRIPMPEMTLRRFLTRETETEPNLIFLLEDVASACRVIAHLVRNGAFHGQHGTTDSTNVQGEVQ
jgi:hypothetical protein